MKAAWRIAALAACAALAGSVLAGPPSHAAHRYVAPKPHERRVLFLFDHLGSEWITGEAVPLDRVIVVMSVDEPCPLDIVGAENMRRAWWKFQHGCWFETLDGNGVFVGETGQILRAGLLIGMVRGSVQNDSVLITEPGYDSLTFDEVIADRYLKGVDPRAILNARQ